MEYTYYTGFVSLLQALAAGAAMGVYYDFFRLLRKLFRCSPTFVAVQDMVFWMSSAIVMFFACVEMNNGYMRIYFVAIALIGWIVYFRTLGRLLNLPFDLLAGLLRGISGFFKKMISTRLSKYSTNNKANCKRN